MSVRPWLLHLWAPYIPPMHPPPGGFGRVLPPALLSPSLDPGRAAGRHVPFYSHIPSVREPCVTTTPQPRPPPSHPLAAGTWGNSRREAEGPVGMRSENLLGRDAHGATGRAETPEGLGRQAWPDRARRRRGSSRAGLGPCHGTAARRDPPSVRGGWVCRQPERFIRLHSCGAAGVVLQLSHPLGLLLVTLPAPQLLLGPVRLGLGCFAAPQVRPWTPHGFSSAALWPFPCLSPLTSPCVLFVSLRCAPTTFAGPDRWVL